MRTFLVHCFALAQRWIDRDQVARLAAGYGENDYGRYLCRLAEDG